MNETPASKQDLESFESRMNQKLDKLTSLVENIEVALSDKVVIHDREIDNLKKRLTLVEERLSS